MRTLTGLGRWRNSAEADCCSSCRNITGPAEMHDVSLVNSSSIVGLSHGIHPPTHTHTLHIPTPAAVTGTVTVKSSQVKHSSGAMRPRGHHPGPFICYTVLSVTRTLKEHYLRCYPCTHCGPLHFYLLVVKISSVSLFSIESDGLLEPREDSIRIKCETQAEKSILEALMEPFFGNSATKINSCHLIFLVTTLFGLLSSAISSQG